MDRAPDANGYGLHRRQAERYPSEDRTHILHIDNRKLGARLHEILGLALA